MGYYTEVAVNVWSGENTFHKILQTVKQQTLKRLIILGQYEHNYWNNTVFLELIDVCNTKNIIVDIVTGCKESYLPMPKKDQYNLYFFPTSFFTKTVYNMERVYSETEYKSLSNTFIQDITTLNYKHHFISMNRRAHNHRQEMIDLLSMYDLLDTNAISWHNHVPYPYDYKFWTPKILELDRSFITEGNNQHKVPKEYYESFAQLVVESTSTEAMFITEKTVVPLLYGKPFIVASCKGFHRYLQELGFQMYDEIFNYDFDQEENQTLRFSMIADNFRKLCNIPYEKLVPLSYKVKDKVEYNKNLAWNLATDYKLFPKPIIDVINLYEKTGIVLDTFTINDYNIIKQLNKNIGI
jgi:hypothetical protein